MKFLALAAVATTAAGAFAQKVPQLLGRSQEMVPVAAYKITNLYKDANGQLKVEHGPAILYHHDDFAPARSTTIAFDAYEFDPALAATSLTPIERPDYDGSNAPCGLGGSRWYFGDAYVNGGSYNDMTMWPGAAGNIGKRVGVGWYNQMNVAFANMALIITTCENFDTVTPGSGFGGANGRGDLSGWLITYGANTNTGGFYYTTDLDATDFGGAVTWTLPSTSNGGYYIIPGDYDAGTNTYFIGASQCMLWGCKPGFANLGSQIDLMLDDDNVIDGTWDPTLELYTYAFGICPDPLGSMFCILYDNAAPVTLAPNDVTPGLGNIISGNAGSLAAVDGNFLKMCKGFVPNVNSPRIRFDCNYTSPYLTPTSLQLDMTGQMTTGGAFKVRAFLADESGTDTFVYGAANQVIADTTFNLTLTAYSSGATATGTHVDTDADTTTDGNVRARVEVQQTGFSAVAVPCAQWDALLLTVTP